MYKFSYAEILDDSTTEARAREQMAMDRAIELLKLAEERGPSSPEAMTAIQYIQRLWNFLIEDLASPSNALAEQLRADLISIGIWVIREANRILVDPSRTFAALIQVNSTVREGLK
jgi:flagellar protein FlaF